MRSLSREFYIFYSMGSLPYTILYLRTVFDNNNVTYLSYFNHSTKFS